jgi:hypothetical protein
MQGLAVESQGTLLSCRGELVQFDAPCNVLIGPAVQLYTATHPFAASERLQFDDPDDRSARDT